MNTSSDQNCVQTQKGSGIHSQANALSLPIQPVEHEYSQNGFCKHCGWEKPWIESRQLDCQAAQRPLNAPQALPKTDHELTHIKSQAAELGDLGTCNQCKQRVKFRLDGSCPKCGTRSSYDPNITFPVDSSTNRYVVVGVVAGALALLSAFVCGYFANDATKGIATGFSPEELKVIPWIVFIMTFVSMSRRSADSKQPVVNKVAQDRRPDATHRTGTTYLDEDGNRRNADQAAVSWQKAAENGSRDAQFKIGPRQQNLWVNSPGSGSLPNV